MRRRTKMSRKRQRGVRARQRGRRGSQDQTLPVARSTTTEKNRKEMHANEGL